MPSRPSLIAQALLEELAVGGAPDVRAVASALGVGIEEADVDSFDGALVRVKGSAEGLIAVRQTIREPGKKNFTIAHELGHLLLPGHDESTVCLQTEVETWDTGVPQQEVEANEFAGELLMPTQVLAKLLLGRQPSFDLVEDLAREFSTSLTATAYRFVEATGHACAVVWSEGGTAKWFKRSEEFTHWVRLRERLDRRTFASNCLRGAAVPVSAESVPASAWLEGRLPDDATVLEQTRCMPSYSGALSLLWLPKPFDSDRHQDDELLAEFNSEDFSLRRKTWPRKK
jgi:hypothetical protein